MRKSPSREYVTKIAAVGVVAPTQQRLGAWVPRSATLLALALLGPDRAGASTARDATLLLEEVDREEATLIERLKDHPEDVGRHYVVEDARRALQRVKSTLREAITLLEG